MKVERSLVNGRVRLWLLDNEDNPWYPTFSEFADFLETQNFTNGRILAITKHIVIEHDEVLPE